MSIKYYSSGRFIHFYQACDWKSIKFDPQQTLFIFIFQLLLIG